MFTSSSHKVPVQSSWRRRRLCLCLRLRLCLCLSLPQHPPPDRREQAVGLFSVSDQPRQDTPRTLRKKDFFLLKSRRGICICICICIFFSYCCLASQCHSSPCLWAFRCSYREPQWEQLPTGYRHRETWADLGEASPAPIGRDAGN